MLNIHALNKAEFRKRKNFRCIHRHDGFSHNNCFEQVNGLVEKVGYLDIETNNLTSSFGIILSYCILSQDNKLFKRIITPEEIKSGVFDKPLLKQFCKDIRNFDRLITWNGFFFDIPFLKSRCDLFSLNFPLYKEIYHTDALLLARKAYRTLHSKRLGEVAKFFGIRAKAHPLNPTIWLKCLSGNKNALSFVGDRHNVEDVETLKKIWERKISPHFKLAKTSI